MFKILALLTKKEGMTRQAFIEHYETRHVPLVCSITAPPPVYKRSYVTKDASFHQDENTPDFDVVTEMVFASREAYQAWKDQIFAPGNEERIIADEEALLDRTRIRAYVFEERVTSQ